MYKTIFVNHFFLKNQYDYHLTLFAIIPIILFIGIFTLRKGNLNFLDHKVTEQIKGISIILIVLFHYFSWVFNDHFYSNFVYYWGEIGVSAFIIMSGMGVFLSYKEKGIQEGYLIRRFLKILVPYEVITVIWVIFSFLLHQPMVSKKVLIAALLGITMNFDSIQNIDPAMWFIGYILFMYLLFYLVFKLKKLNDIQKILLFTVSGSFLINIVGNIFLQHQVNTIANWQLYSLCYPIGAIIGYIYNSYSKHKLKNVSRGKLALFFLGLLLVCFIYGFKGATIFLPNYYIDSSNIFFLSGIVILPVTLIALWSYYSKLFLFIGSISFEIYLIHNPLLGKFDFLLYRKPYVLSLIIYLIFLFITSYLYKKIISDAMYRYVLKYVENFKEKLLKQHLLVLTNLRGVR